MKIPPKGFLLISLALAVSCTRAPRESAANALGGFSVPDLNGAAFTVSQAQRRVNEHTVLTYGSNFQGGELQLTRIENLAPEAARQIMRQKKFQTESLYQEEKSPYPGFLSKTVKCAKDFLPEIELQNEGDNPSLRIRAMANARKSLGVCDAAELHFLAVTLFYYCKKERVLLQIESFLPKTETLKASTFLRKVSC